MSIPWLVSGHIQKLDLKFDKQKTELEKWKNGAGDRIEKKLKRIVVNVIICELLYWLLRPWCR